MRALLLDLFMAGFIAGFDVILISLTIDAVKSDVRESLGLDTTQSEMIWTARNFFFLAVLRLS